MRRMNTGQYIRRLIWLAVGLTVVARPALGGGGQNNSLFLRAEEEIRSRSLRGKSTVVRGVSGSGTGSVGFADQRSLPGRMKSLSYGGYGGRGSLGTRVMRNITPVIEANWFAVEEPTPKDFRVHDLVTIIVNEVSKHTVKADAEAEREHSIDFSLQDWIRLTGGNLRPDRQSRGDPKIKGSFNREFEGESDIKREDTLSARIQAEIIDVMPNGNLILEATHTMVVDGESTVITLTGTCRSKDVGVDNSLISSKISRLEIRKTHAGMAHDTTKRSLVAAILDFLNPF